MNLFHYTNNFPLEFCAARFLKQWEKREESLFNAISSQPTNSDIRNAIKYFQVARSFKGLKNDNAVAFNILKILNAVRSNPLLISPEDKVEDLTHALHGQFKKFTLSAATKLLWLSYRSPYVIYDSRALNALANKAGAKNISKNYGSYRKAWKTEYSNFESSIESAIANLKDGRKFMPQTLRSDRDFVFLSKEPWFKERVFDIFLWEVGGNS